VISHGERRQFDAISRSLAADPDIAAIARRAARQERRRRVWRWLAPLVIARREARYFGRLAEGR
jgi:hypothetical protein